MSKAARNDPKSHKDWMQSTSEESELTPVDVREKEGGAKEVVANVHAQSEGAKYRFGISTTTLSEPQDPGDANSEQTESGPADDESMGYDDLLSDDEFSEAPGDDDPFSQEWAENSSNDEFAEFEWLEPLDGIVTYTGGCADATRHKQIGSCVGKLIRRDRIRHIFYHEMEEPSAETSLLAFDLFDRYGCLKPEYKNHPIRKGSGIWKEELDGGDILLIENFMIDEEYRRRGLGKRVVTELLDKVKEKTRGFFAITRPNVLWTNKIRYEVADKAETEREVILQSYEDIAKAFWRSLGFRRIGSSGWFALASDPGHPCHFISVSDDYNPRVPHHDSSEYPQALITAMMESDEALRVERLAQFLYQTPTTDPSWFMQDKVGNTLLHIAALNSQPSTVDWVMKNKFGQQMLNTRNDAGDTPLEATLMDLEGRRTRRENMCLTLPLSDDFEGYPDTSVLCVARLKSLTEASQLDLARISFGCTCGQCIEGFLSPRMIYALLCQAEVQSDRFNAEIDQDSGPFWVDWNEHMFQYVPENVQNNFKTNKSMRQGFTNMFDHIATCLRTRILPTEVNVLGALQNASEWPPVTKNFLKRGGSVASVATMCFQLAMDQDEFAGDGEHQKTFSDNIELLPECRNDHEFGFVSGMCGYERVSGIHYGRVRGFHF